MTLAYWRDAKSRVVREWHCCGQVWQLLVTAQFPDRQQWRPTCQRCCVTRDARFVGET